MSEFYVILLGLAFKLCLILIFIAKANICLLGSLKLCVRIILIHIGIKITLLLHHFHIIIFLPIAFAK